MNAAAEKHLQRAATYIERGDGFYAKAADELIAGRVGTKNGPTWTDAARAVGKSITWVRDLVHSRTKFAAGSGDGAFRVEWTRGAHATQREIREGAAKLLSEAPLEQVEQIVGSLPPERQQAIAAAAGHSYLGARQEHDEAERRRTPDERREREHAAEEITRPVRQAAGGFAALGIVEHLEQATEDLRELQADASLTPEHARKIGRALDEFAREFEFTRALLGERGDES